MVWTHRGKHQLTKPTFGTAPCPGPTAACTFSFDINAASLSADGAAASFNTTPHNAASAKPCGARLAGLKS